MTVERRWHPHGLRRLFQHVAPDVVGLLVTQGEISAAATSEFLEWSRGSGDAATLTALEHEADAARRTLLAALRGALATPIDQEDLYILSERCDRVVNAVRDIALEAEALAWKPDQHAARMAEHLHAGMTALVGGFAKLRHDFDQAGMAADQVRAEARTVVRRYRDAIAELYRSNDLQAALVGRELYRPYARAADLLEAVADRLWYVVLAEV
ncbi:MAG: DUF47 domain-containing protein [Acidimicrobiales bacterium]